MIGELPTALKVGGEAFPIRTDFRVMLRIYQAWNDPDLLVWEKMYICMKNLYLFPERIPYAASQEAVEKAYWFMGGGDLPTKETARQIRIFDWEQDERLLFPAINKAAGYETRAVLYLHWWSFLGLFGEIGEGLLSTVLHIRTKKAKRKKLDKWEEEYYREHRDMIDLRRRYSKEEQEERDRLNALLG